MRFACESEGVGRVLQRPFRMPARLSVLAFFIVFGGGTMGAGCQFVLFRGLPVCFMHGASLLLENASSSYLRARMEPKFPAPQTDRKHYGQSIWLQSPGHSSGSQYRGIAARSDDGSL